MVVIVHTSLDATALMEEVESLGRSVAAIDPGRIPELAARDWRDRLGKLRRALSPSAGEHDLGVMGSGHGLWRTRSRRSPLDVLGDVASVLIGVATQAEVREVRDAVDQTRKENAEVAHVVNQLTSVVNGSRKLIVENRRRLNEVARLVERLAEAANTTRLLLKNFYSLHTQQNVDRVIRHVEREYLEFRDREMKLNRQRASLEMGRLSEDLLPMHLLQEVVQRAAQEDVVPVEPLEWYYQHTRVVPLWGEGRDNLVFKVELPLVRPVPYLGYLIKTYEVPYSNSTTTVRLQAEGSYGLDTQTGEMFRPLACIGENPQVCRAGPLYSSGGLDCARAVISGRDPTATCKVQVTTRQSSEPRILAGDEPNRLVFLTWGETLTEHCTGQAERTYQVPQGTHAVRIQGGCVVKTTGWSIRGLIERNSTYSRSSRLIPVRRINLKKLLPPDEAQRIPKREHPLFPDLGEVATVPLNPRGEAYAEPFQPIQWKRGRNWWYLLLVPCGLLAAAVLGYVLYRRHRGSWRIPRREPKTNLSPASQGKPSELDFETALPLLAVRSLRGPLTEEDVREDTLRGLRRPISREDDDDPEPPARRRRLETDESDMEV